MEFKIHFSDTTTLTATVTIAALLLIVVGLAAHNIGRFSTLHGIADKAKLIKLPEQICRDLGLEDIR